MGNCQRDDKLLANANFDDAWFLNSSTLHPRSYVLACKSESDSRVFKWVASHSTQCSPQPACLKSSHETFLPFAYQQGTTPIFSQSSEDEPQKRVFRIIEELICLKDIWLSEAEATVIAYKCLQAYQILFRQLSGFVALENMIFINREGIVKVWFNQNLADSWIQYPYPGIQEQQFLESILNHIFTRVQGPTHGIHQYAKSGQLKFDDVIARLHRHIQHDRLPMNLSIDRERFNKVMKNYQGEKIVKKNLPNPSPSPSPSSLKFLVAGTSPCPSTCPSLTSARPQKDYIKDYSQMSKSDFFRFSNIKSEYRILEQSQVSDLRKVSLSVSTICDRDSIAKKSVSFSSILYVGEGTDNLKRSRTVWTR